MDTTSLSNGAKTLNIVLEEQNRPVDIIETSELPSIKKDEETINRNKNTVIQFQPKTNEEPAKRKSLPIVYEWQTLDVRQLNPQYGLQLLSDFEQVLIQQIVEIDPRVEQETRYVVKIPDSLTLYYGCEYSSAWQRFCCGSSRAFTLQLLDPTKQEAIIMVRRLAGTVGCYVQRLEVYIPSGMYIGCVKQETTVTEPSFLIVNQCDTIIFTIKGPKCYTCSMLDGASFKVISCTESVHCATISHYWQDSSGNYGLMVKFPSRNADPRTKALLLAAGFLFEYMFFEKTKTSARCSCFKIS